MDSNAQAWSERARRVYVGRTQPKDISTKFEHAIDAKDYVGARALLADNLSFVGPLETLHTADALIESLKRLGPLVERVDVQRVLGDGEDVAVFCELHMKPPAPARLFVAEWHKVRAGKIASMHIAFDARPFAAMFAKK
jgi:hypothetical protein